MDCLLIEPVKSGSGLVDGYIDGNGFLIDRLIGDGYYH